MGLLGALAGPLIGGITSMLGGQSQNRAAAQQASAQRAWEEHMSDTSWQRGTADMKAAGINPMLSFMQGGASTPTGAVGGVPANPGGAMGQGIGDAVSSAMQMARLQMDIKNMNQQILESAARTQKTNTEQQIAAKELETPGTPDRTMAYWNLLNRNNAGEGNVALLKAQAANVNSASALNRTLDTLNQVRTQTERAGLPAAGVTGSKVAGWVRTLFGGNLVGTAARAAEVF